jgi:negative regulator of flagellin synthesis FlgM
VAARRNIAAYGATSAVTRQPDAVSLSDTAKSMAAALKTVSDSSDVREDKVAALKAALANGTYNVSSRELAQSLSKALF